MSESRGGGRSGAGDQDPAALLQLLARREREIKALESALDVEARMSANLRESLEKLSTRVSQLERTLKQITAERDHFSGQLGSIERMQVATLALEDADADAARIVPAISATSAAARVPDAGSVTISKLMAELAALEEAVPLGHGRFPAASEERRQPDLVAPELIVPEAFGRRTDTNARLRVSTQGACTGSSAPRFIRLDGEFTREYVLTGAELTIGRAAKADICIDEVFVSRIHARVRVTGAGVIVEDAGSRNGVNVNSARIDAPRRLRDGDILAIGRLRLQFIDPGQARASS
jgi:hypothetical protein